MSLFAVLKGKGPSGFGYTSTAEEVTAGIELSGKTFLLTGCNSGIGLETLRVLSLRGAHVIAAARTVEKAQAALAAASKGGAEGTPVACELSQPAIIAECISTVTRLGRPIDGIICNAGIMAPPLLELRHGYEQQFFTNHIGHFILVTSLLDAMAAEGRVVMVSSAAHWSAPALGIQFDNLNGAKGYSPWCCYGQSKLANLLFARALAVRFAGTKRTANAVHPGVIHTNLVRHMNPVARGGMALFGPLFCKSVAQGAATQCYVATHPQLAALSGEYFADCNPARTSSQGADAALAERLWSVSEEIVAGLG